MSQAPGTVGVVSSKGWVSGAIRLATRSHWSHIVVADGAGKVFEALGRGVVHNPEADYDGRDVVWLSGVGMTEAQRVTALAEVRKHDGWKYNYPAIAVFTLRFLGLPHRRIAEWANRRRAVICSELALIGWRAAGFDPWPGLLAATIAPADFADMALRHDWA